MPDDIDEWDEEKCLQLIRDEDKDNKNLYARYRLAAICFEKSDVDGAKKYLKEIHEANAEFFPVKINEGLGEIYEMERDFFKALDHYKKLYKVTSEKQ